MTLIEKAIQLAVRAHNNQEDEGDEGTHIIHCFEVMLRVKQLFNEQPKPQLEKYSYEELIIAAILHDVTEDSFDNPYALERANLNDIENGFGKNVREIVESVTRRKYLNGELNYDLPSNTPGVVKEFYRDLIYRSRDNEGGRILKSADINHNSNRVLKIKIASWRDKLIYKYGLAAAVLYNKTLTWEQASGCITYDGIPPDSGMTHFWIADPNGKKMEISEEEFTKLYKPEIS